MNLRILTARLRKLFCRKPRRPHVLFIDDWVPHPQIGAGAPRAFAILRALRSAGVAVTHFSTTASPAPLAQNELLKDVLFLPHHSDRQSSMTKLATLRQPFILVLISRPHNIRAFNDFCASHPKAFADARIIYDAEAIFSEREILRSRLVPGYAAVEQDALQQELELARTADVILVVNEHSEKQFRSCGYNDVRILRYATAPRDIAPPPAEARSELLFVGPTYGDETPNTDSVVWFVDQVLPSLRNNLGRPLRLTMVGYSGAPAIAMRVGTAIDLRGPLQTLDDTYDRARVFVAPTRFSAGIPLKVYDAALHGVPCVITPLLAEQLGWTHECEALVAESADDFAHQCSRLFQDTQLWASIAAAARHRTLQDCDVDRFNALLAELINEPLPAA